MTDPQIKPSRKWYWLAVALLTTGIGFLVWGVLTILPALNSSLGQQVVVPGSGEIVLDKGGTYNILHEYQTVVNGRMFSAPPVIPGLQVTLTDPDGHEVPLRNVTADIQLSVGQRECRVVWDFTIPSGGKYLLTGKYEQGHTGPQTVLSVGRELGSKIIPFIVGTVLCSLETTGGVIILVAVPLLRMRNRRKLQQAVPAP